MYYKFKDYYDFLGVEIDATKQEIKKAYISKMRELKDASIDVSEKDIKDAYYILSNDKSRVKYDYLYNKHCNEAVKKQEIIVKDEQDSKKIRNLKVRNKSFFSKRLILNIVTLSAVTIGGVLVVTSIVGENMDDNINNNKDTYSTTDDNLTYKDSTITITRIYKVKDGDTIDKIVSDSNLDKDSILDANNLEGNNLNTGDELSLNYTVKKYELEQYTKSIDNNHIKSLYEIADENNTTVETIKKLNEEAVVKGKFDDGSIVYLSYSDTLLVPDFELTKTKQVVKSK